MIESRTQAERSVVVVDVVLVVVAVADEGARGSARGVCAAVRHAQRALPAVESRLSAA